jgi:hypothetical protein
VINLQPSNRLPSPPRTCIRQAASLYCCAASRSVISCAGRVAATPVSLDRGDLPHSSENLRVAKRYLRFGVGLRCAGSISLLCGHFRQS